MKIFKLFLFLLPTIFFVQCEDSESHIFTDSETIIENRDIGKSCLPEPFGDCIDGTFSWVMTLSQYPGCTFRVKVNYRECNTISFDGTVAIHTGEFELVEYDCPQFDIDLASAIQNNTAEQFSIEFNQSIWRQVTSNLLNTTPTGPQLKVLQIEYVIGGCKFQCFTQTLDCGAACCRRVLEYKNINGRWVIENEGKIARIGDDCPSGAGCNPNVLQSASCYDNCASLDF